MDSTSNVVKHPEKFDQVEDLRGNSVDIQSAASDKLPLKQRVSYGMLDAAGNLLYCFATSYILYFYTDVVGIPIIAAGMILLLARIIDGVDAPIWGIIIDKTHSRYGKCRPWFLWLAIPFAVFSVLTFYAPNLSPTMKVIYAGGTYFLANIVFTGFNTPITAILPSLTPQPKERLVLNSFRMVGGQVGFFLMNATALPLVAFLGKGDDKQGFFFASMIFGIVFVLMTLYAFKNLREKHSVKQEEKIPLKNSFLAIKGNWPWVIMTVSNLFFWIAMMGRTSTAIYYFTYNMGQKDMVAFVNSIASLQIIAMVAIPFICKVTSKKNTWIMGLLVAFLGQMMMLFSGSDLISVIIGWILSNMGSGIACAMPFAMLGSAVDFGEWKTGIRSVGFLTAIGSTFCIKAGSGIGAALPAWIMNFYGYIPNRVQTISGLTGIKFAFIWFPAFVFLLAIIPLLFYTKFEKMESQVRIDLGNQE